MNAFRQGLGLGSYLVVGINSDDSVEKHKGTRPLLNEDERMNAAIGCKFVNAIEPACPYIMSDEYLLKMIQKWNIDFVIHGDDPCIVDGKNVYQCAIDINKYKTIPRTEGEYIVFIIITINITITLT